MKQKLLTIKTLLVAAALFTGVSSAFGQQVSWSANTTAGTAYTGGSEQSDNTSVVSFILGATGENWASRYNSKTFAGVCCNNNASAVTLTDGVPTSGTFIKVVPVKDIKLTGDDYSFQICNHYMVCVDAESKVTQTSHARSAAATPDYGKLLAGNTYYLYFGNFKNSTDQYGFKSLNATSYETYTIHYVDNSATPVTIKEDRVVSTSLYGATVSAEESDLANIVYNGNTYAYQSGNTPITLNTSGNDITLVFAKATAANVTVKYMANIAGVNTAIKSNATIETSVGATVSATGENFPTYITYNEVKYKYSSGNDPLTVTGVEEDDVITLVYTPAPIYAYEVNAYDGSDNKLATITSGSYVEGDDAITVAYSQYVLSGTTLYNIANNGTGDYYRKSFTPDADDYEYKLVYNGSSVSDVVYFTEVENLSSITTVDYTNRASNGQVAHTGGADTYSNATTLNAGIYKIYMRSINSSDNAANVLNVNFKAGDNIVYSVEGIGQGTNITDNSDEFVVASDGTSLDVAIKGHSGGGVDWFYVVKIDDLPATETIKVTDAGMATYVSNYSLDFTGKTTKAYKVSVASKGVATLSEVTKVPAKTPVLLVCDGGNGEGEAITVTSDAIDAITGNDLVAGTGAAVATANGDYTNMILNNVGGNVGFYFAAGNTVASNRAYLHIAKSLAPASAGAPMMLIFADDVVTGINTVNGSAVKANGSEGVYNLSGQRVAKPTRGLYIVNGKKVVVK